MHAFATECASDAENKACTYADSLVSVKRKSDPLIFHYKSFKDSSLPRILCGNTTVSDWLKIKFSIKGKIEPQKNVPEVN